MLHPNVPKTFLSEEFGLKSLNAPLTSVARIGVTNSWVAGKDSGELRPSLPAAAKNKIPAWCLSFCAIRLLTASAIEFPMGHRMLLSS